MRGVRWRGGEGGEVERWRGGEVVRVVRWRGGEVERWRGGEGGEGGEVVRGVQKRQVTT